jgi:ankyrin repeat protein
MKTIAQTILAFVLITSAAAQQPQPGKDTSLLEKGLFEEEVQQNYPAAAEHYSKFLQEQEKFRRNAAIALFRLAEVYRKQGKTDLAMARYQEVLQRYPDQTNVAAQARAQLPSPPPPPPNRVPLRSDLNSKTAANDSALPDAGSMHPEALFLRELRHYAATSPDLLHAKNGERLLIAAQSGWLSAVQFLLENGGNVNDARGGRTPLHAATIGGHKAVVSYLLEKRADPNIPAQNGLLPLHEAAKAGYTAVAELLIPKTRQLDLIVPMEEKITNWPIAQEKVYGTPLHLAVRANATAMVKLLLDAGANPNVSVRGITPLHEAVVLPPGDTRCVELLLSKKADPNARASKSDDTLLWVFRFAKAFRPPFDSAPQVERGNLFSPRVIRYDSLRTEFLNMSSFSPLQVAAASGNNAVVSLLLNAGGDPNVPEFIDPLQFATFRNDPATVRLLLERGAKPNHPGNISAVTPSPLTYAAFLGSTQLVELLLQAKADPNVGPITPLTAGAEFRAIVERLLGAGADPNLPSGIQRNVPLHFATEERAAKALLAAGAKPNIRNLHGNTPLLVHSRWGRVGVALALLDAGADGNAANHEGNWPATLPSLNPQIELALQQRGFSSSSGRTNVILFRRKGYAGETILHATMNSHLPPTLAELLNATRDQVGHSFNYRIKRRTNEKEKTIDIDLRKIGTNSVALEWGDQITTLDPPNDTKLTFSPFLTIHDGAAQVVKEDGNAIRWELRTQESERPNFMLKDRLAMEGIGRMGAGISFGEVVVKRPAKFGLPAATVRIDLNDPASDLWLRDGDEVRFVSQVAPNATADPKIAPAAGQVLVIGKAARGNFIHLMPQKPTTLLRGLYEVGLTEFANTRKIKLSRRDPQTKNLRITEHNLELIKKGEAEDPVLQDGDQIEVNERSMVF